VIKDDEQDEVAATQAAEAWKADAAPGIKKPERDDSALWDPVIRAPEVRAPEAEELPVARVVKMDMPPKQDEDPAIPIARLVPAILPLLQDGSINAALAIEEDWREGGGSEDLGGASALVRGQWPLVRELLGVATELPVPVVQAFAEGISTGEASTARPALQAFRKTDASAANAANGLLAVRAKRLYDATGGSLYTAPPARPDYYANYVPPPSISKSSGLSSWRLVSIGAVVISGILRIASQSHSSYDYDYHPIDIPNLPPMPAYDPSLYNTNLDTYTPPAMTLPPAPLPMQRDAERSLLLDEIILETQNITTYGLVPEDHQDKVDVFMGDALDDVCARMRISFVKVEKLKPIDDAEKAASAKEQLTAIRQRLDVVCPKKKK